MEKQAREKESDIDTNYADKVSGLKVIGSTEMGRMHPYTNPYNSPGHGILESTDDKGSQQTSGVKWSDQNIKLLIEEYKNKKEQFKNPHIMKRGLWETIANNFQQKGINFSWEIIEKKFRNMRKTYAAVKANSNSNGRNRATWAYFDTFEELFSDDPAFNDNEETGLSLTVMGEPQSKKNKFVCRSLREYRRESLKIEKRKVEALERLEKNVAENTNVQKERNALFARYIKLLEEARRPEF